MESVWRLCVKTRFLLALCLLGFLLNGCDSGQFSTLPDASGGVPSNPEAPSNTLTMDLSSVARSSRDIARVEVTAFSLRGAELTRQQVPSSLMVSLPRLPAGSARLRTVAFKDSGKVLGYSDLLVAVPNAKTVIPPPFELTDRVPPPATPGAPFLAFLVLPSTFEAGTTYSLEIGAFDTQGKLDTTVENSLTFSSSGAPATLPSTRLKFVQGRAVVGSVLFRRGTNGTVTFSASASGFASVTSPTLPVRSR